VRGRGRRRGGRGGCGVGGSGVGHVTTRYAHGFLHLAQSDRLRSCNCFHCYQDAHLRFTMTRENGVTYSM
jgi:hypothetical protein